MDMDSSDKVLAFDSLFTTNHIQILKVLLPYLGHSVRGKLAVYIKLLELQYTLAFFQRNPSARFTSAPGTDGEPRSSSDGGSLNSMMAICDEILPYCSPTEKEKLQNLKNTFRNIENMQEIMQVMEMMKEISPELFTPNAPNASGGDSSGSPLDMLSGLGGMDMAQMMELLQGMFGPAAPPEDETR